MNNFEKWKNEFTLDDLIKVMIKIDMCLGKLCPLKNKCDLSKLCSNNIREWGVKEVTD